MRVLLLIRKENSDVENIDYIKAIKLFGGEVVLIEDNALESEVYKKLKTIDGVLLPGGDNIGRLDFFIINYAYQNNLRMLGICQGMQSMALWKSKDSLISLENDIHYSPDKYKHSVILNDSLVKSILKKDKLMVNSHHKQHVVTSTMFKVVGFSDDGVVEVIENSNASFQIGVQWHPERMIDYDEYSRVLFRKFLSDDQN